MDYPVTLTRDDNNTYLVEFPDFPEAHTFGESIEDALAHAKDALLTAVDAYMKDRRDVPDPSATVAKYRVAIPALMEAKVALYRTMRSAKVNKSELARRLDVHPPQVDRLFDVRHGSKFEQLEAAFSALGKRVSFRIEDAAPVPHARRRAAARRSSRAPARRRAKVRR